MTSLEACSGSRHSTGGEQASKTSSPQVGGKHDSCWPGKLKDFGQFNHLRGRSQIFLCNWKSWWLISSEFHMFLKSSDGGDILESQPYACAHLAKDLKTPHLLDVNIFWQTVGWVWQLSFSSHLCKPSTLNQIFPKSSRPLSYGLLSVEKILCREACGYHTFETAREAEKPITAQACEFLHKQDRWMIPHTGDVWSLCYVSFPTSEKKWKPEA